MKKSRKENFTKLTRKGISLLVLIVTIVVIIILSTVIILSINNNNPINSAKEVVFREDISNFKAELEMYKSEMRVRKENPDSLVATMDTSPNIQEIITNMSDKYTKILEIQNGKLVYTGKDKTLYMLAREIGLLSSQDLLNDEILTELRPMITEWTVESGDSITLPVSGKCDLTVDYGDGTGTYKITSASDEDRIHTYQNAGTYTVTLEGKTDNFSFYSVNTSKDKITKLVQWGNIAKDGTYSFSGCLNLSGQIPEPSSSTFKNVKNVSTLFNGCSNLTGSIPKNLFKGAEKLEEFGISWGVGAFKDCTGLTGEIPEGLFDDCINAKTFAWVFYNCSGLTGKIPNDLFKNCTNVTTFSGSHWNNTGGGAFEGCTGLTELPDNLFSSCIKATDFTAVFKGCSSLTNIPENLFSNCSSATDFAYAFSGCSSITGVISSNLFADCQNVTTFSNTFNGCAGIQKAGDLFANQTKATTFSDTFNGCSSLREISPNIFSECSEVDTFVGCFRGCNSLASIPKGIFDDCVKVTNFGAVFQECKSIKEIPVDLFKYNTEVTTFGNNGKWWGVFLGCTNITSVPQDLFRYNTKATEFSLAFSGCTNLVNIPIDLFEYNVEAKIFLATFFQCNNLQGNAPELWNNSNITSYSRCFFNCTKLSNYSEIPVEWKK